MHGRILAGVVMLMASVSAVQAKSHFLGEKLVPGDCFRVELDLKIEGTMTFARGDKKSSLPLRAIASHVFPERILSVAKNGLPEKTARHYEKASAAIQAGEHSSERSLRQERRLFVAQWQNDQPLAYSPSGPLFRSELDLCSEHFDTLHLAGLLPGKDVEVGDTWKIAPVVVQALGHFDALTENSLTGKLESVNGTTATIRVQGKAQGVELGALVNLSIEANCEFDLEAKRLVRVVWKQQDERDIGPANPASTITSTTTISRTPVKTPDSLADVQLSRLPEGLTVPPEMLQLDYAHPKNVFDLLYTRDWSIVSDTEEQLVMRLVDRGDFVAQVRVKVLRKAQAGKTTTPAEFAKLVERQPGWKMEKEMLADEVPSEKDRKIHRLSQLGKLDETDVMQNSYLITFEDGRQLSATFTMAPKQADKLDTRDLTLVGSIDFPKAK